MSRSSEFNTNRKRILKFNESEDFLNFNDFGPVSDDEIVKKQMTLDEFIHLPIFTIENSQKALLAIKSNEICILNNADGEEVTLTTLDDASVTVKYGDIELEFDKNDIISAFEEKIEMEVDEVVVESVQSENEMPSVLKFKEFLEIEKLEADNNGKDNF